MGQGDLGQQIVAVQEEIRMGSQVGFYLLCAKVAGVTPFTRAVCLLRRVSIVVHAYPFLRFLLPMVSVAKPGRLGPLAAMKMYDAFVYGGGRAAHDDGLALTGPVDL